MTVGCKYSIHDEYCELRKALAEASILLELVCFGVCDLSRREMRVKIQSFKDILARRRKQMRQGCIQCFLKHIGNAAVLLEEVYDGYDYKHLVLGHLDQAAQEIREFSDRLAAIVRAHRIQLLDHNFTGYKIPFEAFERFANVLEEVERDNVPGIPQECYEGLDRLSDGSMDLKNGDQR